MSRILRVAGALDVVAGVWGAYVSLVAANSLHSCPLNGCPYSFNVDTLPWVLVGASSLLVLAGLATFVGLRTASLAGILISLGALLGFFVDYVTFGDWRMLIAMALLVASAMLGTMGARSRGTLTEQQNPMNLPVFG